MTIQHHRTDGAHARVLAVLDEAGPMTLRELYVAADLALDTVRGALTELGHEGRVVRVARGTYAITRKGHDGQSR